jgi:hypothetical protein
MAQFYAADVKIIAAKRDLIEAICKKMSSSEIIPETVVETVSAVRCNGEFLRMNLLDCLFFAIAVCQPQKCFPDHTVRPLCFAIIRHGSHQPDQGADDSVSLHFPTNLHFSDACFPYRQS